MTQSACGACDILGYNKSSGDDILVCNVPIVIHCLITLCVSEQLERTKNYVPKKQFWKAVNVLEYKFLSIPIAFFLLRMWTCIINLYVYSDNPGRIPQALVYLSVSILDYRSKSIQYPHCSKLCNYHTDYTAIKLFCREWVTLDRDLSMQFYLFCSRSKSVTHFSSSSAVAGHAGVLSETNQTTRRLLRRTIPSLMKGPLSLTVLRRCRVTLHLVP